MRVLVITPLIWNLGEGAGMPSAYRTMAGFRDAGFEVHVLIPASEPWPEPVYHGLHVHTYRVPRFGLAGDFGPTRSALLVDLPPGRRGASLRWKGYLGAVSLLGAVHGARLARRLKPQVVYGMMPMGAVAASVVGRLAGAPNVTRLFGTMLGDVPRRQLLRHLWELAAMKAPADMFVMVDDGTAGDEMARRFGMPAERIQFLMNGVDERYFEPWAGPSPAEIKRGLGLEPGTPLLLCAHQLRPWHQQRALVDAMEVLRGRGVPGVAVLAGDGPDRPELERLVAARGLGDRVLLLGNVARDRILELMAATTVMVSLDEYSNIVNSVLEGLAMGIPVVATETGTTTRLLTDGVDSLLLAPTSVPALAEALERVLVDGELLERLRAGARGTAARRLETWDARIAREARLLEQLAGVAP
jgi:glycosyltransferase involved in cell wall biosynthesis